MVISRTPQRTAEGPVARYRGIAVFALLLGSILLAACSSLPSPARSQLEALPPLSWQGREYPVTLADARITDPDLLSIDDEMREFVARYTGDVTNNRQRLRMLHAAIKGPATLGIEYDAMAGGGARDVFHRGSANCLSYASLFIALAREAGLDASYQWLEVRPSWTRDGERVLVNLHINVDVDLGRQERYMIDIDPLPTRDIAGTRRITDAQAIALHHGNYAMRALAKDDPSRAFLHTVRALELDPELSHMWVNLGVIYRYTGQNRLAEQMYRYALELDPWENSAMNNLVVLYTIEDKPALRAQWEERVSRYRASNPYYFAWLGEEAASEGDWETALENYAEALRLAPDDSQLLFEVGLAHEQLGQPGIATRYIQRAIDMATLRSEVDTYRAHLRGLRDS